jgi:hypothetical protein
MYECFYIRNEYNTLVINLFIYIYQLHGRCAVLNNWKYFQENSLPVFTNQNTLPPLQHVRIESPNNNTAFTGYFQENQNNNLEEVQDEPTDVMVIEKDLEVKSTLSGSKESSDEEDADAGVDEEMSPKSGKPEKDKRVCV